MTDREAKRDESGKRIWDIEEIRARVQYLEEQGRLDYNAEVADIRYLLDEVERLNGILSEVANAARPVSDPRLWRVDNPTATD